MNHPLNYGAVFDSPIGKIAIQTENSFLMGIHFLKNDAKTAEPTSSLEVEAKRQLLAYFKGSLQNFDLPLSISGSSFQQSVLKSLLTIPFGKTKTYGELAKQLMTSPRAIGNACRHNALPIIIPCHRVIAKNHLGGYSGETAGVLLAMKSWLLQHETKK